MKESLYLDKKSLKFLNGNKTDWYELAKDCVAFANAQGGKIIIGIEDKSKLPPAGQLIIDRNVIQEIKKKVTERTTNVALVVSIETASNKSEYILIEVLRNAQTLASTNDGKYYVRNSDSCKPVPPDEMARLAAEKNAFVWELQINKRVKFTELDVSKKSNFIRDIRLSSRVSAFVKEKSDEEILEYYFLKKDDYLTNLGILWIGKREDRATLLHPLSIQVIRYNEFEEKVWKLLLDDHYLNPKEMLEKVLIDVPDWQESFEISEGMFRKNIFYFPLEVVRELVVNALAHRTYTTRGDIFINIYPERLEIHSPGRLPYGVTPENILSQSVRRNEHLSKIFYDLELMEKEGSGYDLIYAKLLFSGKPIPEVIEGDDRVTVIVKKQYISKEIVKMMDFVNLRHQLKQKEMITLGLIAQNQSLSSTEMSKILNQNNEQGLRSWIGRLIEFEIITTSGKKRGTQYSINPKLLKNTDIVAKTSLKSIEDHRLEELIYQDIKSYPNSSFGEIHKRIGLEINRNKVKRILREMHKMNKLTSKGVRRGTTYTVSDDVIKTKKVLKNDQKNQ
ncbi:MAG TPA: ATP-binding protein [Clostridiales bacterium]|nr:ATP-binding protein [Clostridiales bacterium]HQP70761.1 ATP-binding protein [Clostridiales bacterium]